MRRRRVSVAAQVGMVDVDAGIHDRDLHTGTRVAGRLSEICAGHLDGRGQLGIGGRLGTSV